MTSKRDAQISNLDLKSQDASTRFPWWILLSATLTRADVWGFGIDFEFATHPKANLAWPVRSTLSSLYKYNAYTSSILCAVYQIGTTELRAARSTRNRHLFLVLLCGSSYSSWVYHAT